MEVMGFGQGHTIRQGQQGGSLIHSVSCGAPAVYQPACQALGVQWGPPQGPCPLRASSGRGQVINKLLCDRSHRAASLAPPKGSQVTFNCRNG